MARNGSDKGSPVSITILADGIAEGYRLGVDLEGNGTESGDRHEEKVAKAAARAAYDRADALAAALLHLDANSQEEALSLLLVFETEFDAFAANYCSADEAAQEAQRSLRRALRAVIRGTVDAGAMSPLLGTYARADHFEPLRAH